MATSCGLAPPSSSSLRSLKWTPSSPRIACPYLTPCFQTVRGRRLHRLRLPLDRDPGGAGTRRSLIKCEREQEVGGKEGSGKEEDRVVRTLLIDNYDSYTYNIYQELSVVNGLPPVVVRNDEWTWEYIRHQLYEEKAFDNIVISPGPGSPSCPADVGICLQVLLECEDIPILGVCLGHQALGFVHGAQIVHAPEPVHGRLSEVEHTGGDLFSGIPSGSKSGFKVVRYHSLVVDQHSLPKDLIPVAWTASSHTLSFHGILDSDMFCSNPRNQKNQLIHEDQFAENVKLLSSDNATILMGIRHSTRPHYGVQFHPESIATCHGRKIFENFKKTTVTYGLGSSAHPERKVQNSGKLHPFLVSHVQQMHKEVTNGKLLASKLINGHNINIHKHSPNLSESTDIKHLKMHWRKLDGLVSQIGGPENIFLELFGDQNGKDTFWLDSSSTEMRRARFSFMGGKGGHLWKQVTFCLSDQRNKCGGYLTTQDVKGSVRRTYLKDGFLDFLNKELQSFHYDKEDYEGLPFDFCGGFVGFIGYDMKIECGALSNGHKTRMPDACFFFADNVVVIDHSNEDVYILSVHDTVHSVRENSNKNHWLDEIEKRLLGLRAVATMNSDKQKSQVSPSRSCKPRFVVEKSRHQYMEDVGKCLDFIRDGESYELCLTTQMRTGAKDINALGLYFDLRKQNPAPYAAWLNFSKERLSVCCSSPERFLRLDGEGMLEAKPIKGTIARGTTLEEDEHQRLQLQYSEKDQAENLMIVDLLRNDLGRVCEPGTVHVPRLMEVESYATLHTLVSTIRGKKSSLSPIDCVKAAFPGGSMTGAPKLRSMELLDSLECCSRGIYSGSIGFFSYNQTFDLNIVIRTVVLHEDEASIGAGGAVVALSKPEDEYEEMVLKARAPAKAVERRLNELDSCDRRSMVAK